MSKPSYDTSTKPYEILRIEYVFDKYTRKLFYGNGQWPHFKYYKTAQGAQDAITAFRQRARWDTPGAANESKYPDIKPRIYLYRYKMIKRF
jgi:hypothetical protein